MSVRYVHEEAIADLANQKIEWALSAIEEAVTAQKATNTSEFSAKIDHAKVLLRQALILTEQASLKYNEPRLR